MLRSVTTNQSSYGEMKRYETVSFCITSDCYYKHNGFGKLYKRDFIVQNKIHFNDTRANEDTGFNTWVRLLCSNDQNRVHWINEVVYYWHENENSITRINNCQYAFDQSFCGWTDNMIYAITEARKQQPFNGYIDQWTLECMIQLYSYYIETIARNPIFSNQNWEYVKKYYHACYKTIEPKITDDMFAMVYSMNMQNNWGSGKMAGIIPEIGIKEFMDKLHTEPYDPDYIYEVWKEIPQDLIKNNETCGVCPKDYTKKKTPKVNNS